MLSYYADRTTIKNCTLTRNTAKYGGALFVFTDNDYLSIVDSFFLENEAHSSVDAGGAIMISNSVGSSIRSTLFQGNRAENGNAGAVAFATLIEDSSIIDCVFLNNFARLPGGAVYLGLLNDGTTLTNNSFVANKAQLGNGGGVFWGNSNGGVISRNSWTRNTALSGGGLAVTQSAGQNDSFTLNVASVYGGGLFLGSSSENITIRSCEFAVNTGLKSGGAMLFGSLVSSVSLRDLAVQGNTGERGGGIVLDALVSNCVIELVTFEGNTALTHGAALLLGTQNYNVFVRNCSFKWNSAGTFGGAIQVHDGNVDVEISSCLIINNACQEDGAGIAVFYRNRRVAIRSSILDSNRALKSGGAISVSLSNTDVRIEDCSVQNNVASDSGGGLQLSSANQAVHVLRASFELNDGGRRGGAVFLGKSNSDIVVMNCFVKGCYADSGGGVFSLSADVYIGSTDFNYNFGVSGGALFVAGSNTTVRGVSFYVNTGFSGPAALFSNAKGVVISDVIAISNSGYQECGGAILAKGGERLLVSQSQFQFNDCIGGAVGGGAITILDTRNATVTSSVFEFNRARAAGGAALYLSVDAATVSNCTFRSNQVEEGRGAVYWAYKSNRMRSEPSGLSQCTFLDIEGYPLDTPDVATAAMAVRFATADYPTFENMTIWPEEELYVINVTSYTSSMPPVYIVYLDYYGQIDFGLHGVFLEATAGADELAAEQCLGVVSGESQTAVYGGAALFDQMSGACLPRHSMSVAFKTQLSTVTAELAIRARAVFRPCRDGEIEKGSACVVCPFGTYTFTDHENGCRACPSNTGACYSDQLEVDSGFYRNHKYAHTVMVRA
jgi:hypothetical protein